MLTSDADNTKWRPQVNLWSVTVAIPGHTHFMLCALLFKMAEIYQIIVVYMSTVVNSQSKNCQIVNARNSLRFLYKIR